MSERHFRRLRDRFEAEGAQGPCSGSNPYAGRQRVALLYLRYFNRLASSTGGFPHVTWPGHHVAIIGSLFNCRHGRDPIALSTMEQDLRHVIQQALEDARAAGRDHLTQTELAVRAVLQVRPDMTAPAALTAVDLVRRSCV